jgi:hypothetical protein
MVTHFVVGLLATALALAVPQIQNTNYSYSGDWPAAGEHDSSVPLGDGGSGTFASSGTKRYSDRGYLVTTPSGYGWRCSFKRTYDFTKFFEFKIDLAAMPGDHTALLMISDSGTDPYIDGNGSKLSMDLVKSPLDSNDYALTLTTGAHNTSITGTEWPTTAWSGNSAYTGLELTNCDGVLDITFTVNGDNVAVGVNGTSYAVPKATLFANLAGADLSKLYVAFGSMNGGNNLDKFDIQKIGDANDEVYYGETGDYTVQKGYISELTTKTTAAIDTIDKLNEVKAIKAKVNFDLLKDYDVNYLKPAYDAAIVIIDQATIALGNEAIISDYKDVADAFVAATDGEIKTTTVIDAALTKYAAIADKEAWVDGITNATEAQQEEIKTLKASVATAYTKLTDAIIAYYKASVEAFETATADLSTIEKLNSALQVKTLIVSSYRSYLSEEDQATYDGKLTAAYKKITEKGQAAPEGWTIGNRAYTIKNDTKMGLLSSNGLWGETQLDVENTNALIYSKEKLSATDLTVDLDIKNWSTVDGAWFSIGLMEHPGYFSTAEDDSVQNNKGIFFLLRSNVGNTSINIDTYILTLTSNRFFDGELATKVDIPMADHLTIKFEEITQEVAGVTDTYFVPSFNGTKLDNDHVKASKIKASLGTDKSGYLYLGSNAATATSPFMFELTNVNGHNPYEASLIKTYTAPTSTATSAEYVVGSAKDLVVNFDAKGEDVSEVKVGDKTLTSDQFVYNDTAKTMTIKAAALTSFAAGVNKNLVITTKGGSVTIAITFKAAEATSSSVPPTTSTPTTSSSEQGGSTGGNGCGGAIAGTVAASAIALGAVLVLARKRKHND